MIAFIKHINNFSIFLADYITNWSFISDFLQDNSVIF